MSTLSHEAPSGIELDALYWDAGGQGAELTIEPGWDVRAIVDSGDLGDIRRDIDCGATSLWLREGAAVTAAELHGLDIPVYSDRDAISGLDAHDSGADDATELALLIDALRAVPSDGRTVGVRTAIGCDVFASISKLRALRVLCGDRAVQLHAVQSRRWLADKDVGTNMIRGTAAVFAAAVGGADAISTWPWDRAVGPASRHARRIALTLHAVAAREAQLDVVADPAAGSYLVERWTAALVKAATDRLNDASVRSYTDTAGPQIGVTLYTNPADEQ